MAKDRKSDKLKRLVAVQRHLEKIAENDLADTTRQRADVGESMTMVMDAITSLSELHRPFARNYSERFSRLMFRDQQLSNLQRTHESRILKERTKGDRLEERMEEARGLEERAAEDEAVYDLLDMTLANSTPASSKLRSS
ncbi:hypothetical protein NOF55_17080 [Rhizobiaceae bacterium BDR2-2]|uniref:Flagellar FliJ protein n=1 Tax=Ectorhizobium quercum TaxID=2965071 RepID=A0AAE3SX96_9HYPH|nr:hypothetical protein [Ectorhizobium quercum]MCX8996132.1 hypothetical protein [Ectorhizobium quercum]MCX8998829.1 hypothetical protein [Ectorhizobium quercum]